MGDTLKGLGRQNVQPMPHERIRPDERNESMGNEKREFPRMLAEWRASLVFENREISTNLRNISKGGAYLRVKDEDAHKIASTDVGQPCSLRMEQANESVSQRGQISRYIVESGSTYVAVAFARRPKALV